MNANREIDVEEFGIFQKCTPDFEKLKKYGFAEKNDCFILERLFKNDLFKAIITIDFSGKLSGVVYDMENNDEFLPLRALHSQGAFVGEVRSAYLDLLKDIKEKCFAQKYYTFPQSNRITNLIIKKYNDYPEFLWDKFKGTGIFRNKNTKKWYLAIMDVDRSKIQPDKKGLVEIALIKLDPEHVIKITKEKNFYPGYHMNKKHWISVILDESVSDEKIMELIEESHKFALKK